MGTGHAFLVIAVMTSLLNNCGVHSQPPPLADFAAFCNEIAISRNAPNAFVEILCRQLAETLTTESPAISVVSNVSNPINSTEMPEAENKQLPTATQVLTSQLKNDSNATLQVPISIAENTPNEITDTNNNSSSNFTEVLPVAKGRVVTILNDTVTNSPVESELATEIVASGNNSADIRLMHQSVGLTEGSESQLLHFSPPNISWDLGDPVSQQRGSGNVDQIVPSTSNFSINKLVKVNNTVVEGVEMQNVTVSQAGGTNAIKLKRGDIMPVILNETESPNQDSKTSSNETLGSVSSISESPGAPLPANLSSDGKESTQSTLSNVTKTNILVTGEEQNRQQTKSASNNSESQSKVNTESKQEDLDRSSINVNSSLQTATAVTNNLAVTIVHSTETHGQEFINVTKASGDSMNQISTGSVSNTSVVSLDMFVSKASNQSGSVSNASVVSLDMFVSKASNQSGEIGQAFPTTHSASEEKLNPTDLTTVQQKVETGSNSNMPNEQVNENNLGNNMSSGSELRRNTVQSSAPHVGTKTDNEIPVKEEEQGVEENENSRNRSEGSLNVKNNSTFTAGWSSGITNDSAVNTGELVVAVPSPKTIVEGNSVTARNGTSDSTNHQNDSSTFIGGAHSGIHVYEENLQSNQDNDTSGTEQIASKDHEKGILNETKDQLLMDGQKIDSSMHISQVIPKHLENQQNSSDLNVSKLSIPEFPDNNQSQQPRKSSSGGSLKSINISQASGSELIEKPEVSPPVSKFSISEVEETQERKMGGEAVNQQNSDSVFDVKSAESELSVSQQVHTTTSSGQVTKEIILSSTEGRKVSSASRVTVLPSGSVDGGFQETQSPQSTKHSSDTVKSSSDVPPEFVSSIPTPPQGSQKTILTELSSVLLGSLANVHYDQWQQEFWNNVSVILQWVAASSELSLEDVTRSVTEVIESYRRGSPHWSAVADRLEEAMSDGEWQGLLGQLLVRHAGDRAAQLRLLSAAWKLRAAVRAAVSSPECRALGPQPAAGSCDAFVLCYRAGWLWRAQELPCPRGSAFSSSQRRCVWRPLSDCQDSDSDSSDSSDSDSSEAEKAAWPVRFGRSLLRFLGFRRS